MSVYFAQVGHYVKVGYSTNPERRVRRMFSGATRYGAPVDCPTDLASRHLIRAIDGTFQDEQQIHAALSDYAVADEWYVDEPPLRDYIASVEPGGSFARLARPEGPTFVPHDESRDLSTDEMHLLRHALAGLFPAPSTLPRLGGAA